MGGKKGSEMQGIGKKAAAAALVLACLTGQAQAAANDCWSHKEIAAAKIRNLQTMLMVAALRCNASRVDVLAGYNAFVRANRATIVNANGSLKSYFARHSGAAVGQRRYDRFTTALANGFGAGASDTDSCSRMAEIAYDAESSRGSADQLLAIADRERLQPMLPTLNCPLTFAAK